jgi:ribosomal protein S18 acetylase RimI-like enzyme
MDANQPLQIRVPTRLELPAVCALAGELARMHHGFDPARFLLPERVEAGYERFFASELRDPHALVLAALLDDRIVGYAYGRLEPRDWNMLLDAHGALHDLYVDPAARHRGVARRLVREALRRLEEMGAPRVVLHTAQANESAQRFFESLGFRRTMVEMTRERGD